jgi:D-amino-acid dehydrogenase
MIGDVPGQPGSGSVVVIGSGVIGTMCGYYLSKSGWAVTLIDQGQLGSGCSHANCGFIVPSHVLPLAEPGALQRAITGLLATNSPLLIRPRIDLGFWSWLWNFSRRCNLKDALAAGAAIHALLDSSRALYDELTQTESLDCEWESRGLYHVFRTPARMDEFARTEGLVRREFGVGATRVDGEALHAREPSLRPGVAGGWYYAEDAHLRPDRLLSELVRLLQDRGATLRPQCKAIGFVVERGAARAVNTTAGEIAADAFVVATGAWTPSLARSLGNRIPIQPGKGYSITMRRPSRCPTTPMLFPEFGVAVTPLRSGYRLGSTLEFAGYDPTLRPDRLELLRRAAAENLVEPLGEPVEEQWFGWRPMTYDGKPVIGRSRAMSNVVIAAGHNMLGVSMAPATGKLVTELLGGGTPHLDPEPYSAARFG